MSFEGIQSYKNILWTFLYMKIPNADQCATRDTLSTLLTRLMFLFLNMETHLVLGRLLDEECINKAVVVP